MPNGYSDLVNPSATANFSHLKALYFEEEHLALRVAHSLRKVSLCPNNIAKTLPLHALSKSIN